MGKLTILILFLLSLQVQGQQFYSSLYGFKLGQYRATTRNEFGKPFLKGKFDDGFIYEAYLLKPDTSFFIIFEYSNIDTNLIWSIQVSGSNSQMDIGLKNAKLGLDKSQTESHFGDPSLVEDIGDYGQKWVYAKTNLSLEVNKKGKLSSVKILDNSNELYPTPDISKIPSLDVLRKSLSSSNNSDILNMLSGDIEVYKNKTTFSFKKSFRTEQATDYSNMISLIREITKDLSKVNTNNLDEYEENMRLSYGQDIKHVMKFKKGQLVNEIVFKYYGGQYLIYEINAN
jgi:hypothetical protein